jgi:hypothetical protein
MNDTILNIDGIPVFVGVLPSGDIKVWHPYNERARHIVEPICRGRGTWNPRFKNWIVSAAFKDIVLSELQRVAAACHE